MPAVQSHQYLRAIFHSLAHLRHYTSMNLCRIPLAHWLQPALFVLTLLGSHNALAALRVELRGVEGELKDNVLALLTVQRERETEGLSEGHIRRYFQRGAKEIRQALEPFGYYAVRVESHLEQSGEDWIAHFFVVPGEPLRFATVEMRLRGAGAQDATLLKLIKKSELKPGVVARHSVYETAKSRLQKQAFENGYLDAQYTVHELRIDTVAQTAAAILELDTGSQFYFGPIGFNYVGLDDDLLRRYVDFKAGEPFSNRRLLELQRALEDSDYFEQVDVEASREQAVGNAVPINVELTARKRHKYTAGLGFGTDTGARGLLGWEHRRINRFGHRMKAEIRASQIGQDLTLNYSLPLKNPRTDRLDFTAAVQEEDTDTVESSLQKIAVGRIVKRGLWRETLSLSYERESYEVGLTDETTSLLIPGISYAQVRADNRLIAGYGRRLQYDLRGAAEPLLSDTSFVQAEVQAKWIRSIGKSGRWIGRLEGGTTWVDDFELLPVSARFFAGGDQSVRGYGFQELGPLDASGEVVGGKHTVLASLEYEQRLFGNWGVAVFVDSGGAFNAFAEGIETGAGIGLRWASPIGMVRVDVAAAVSQDNALRLHFTLGPDL